MCGAASIKLLAMMTVAANNEALLSQFLPEMNKVVDGMLASVAYEEGHEGEEPMPVRAPGQLTFFTEFVFVLISINLFASVVESLWPATHPRDQQIARSVRQQRYAAGPKGSHDTTRRAHDTIH
jgi:hypothetical protein